MVDDLHLLPPPRPEANGRIGQRGWPGKGVTTPAPVRNARAITAGFSAEGWEVWGSSLSRSPGPVHPRGGRGSSPHGLPSQGGTVLCQCRWADGPAGLQILRHIQKLGNPKCGCSQVFRVVDDNGSPDHGFPYLPTQRMRQFNVLRHLCFPKKPCASPRRQFRGGLVGNKPLDRNLPPGKVLQHRRISWWDGGMEGGEHLSLRLESPSRGPDDLRTWFPSFMQLPGVLCVGLRTESPAN